MPRAEAIIFKNIYSVQFSSTSSGISIICALDILISAHRILRFVDSFQSFSKFVFVSRSDKSFRMIFEIPSSRVVPILLKM